MRTATLSEYLASQEELVQEAALALPHQFDECTYSKGPIRQAAYLCTTCPEARGICSACSIACHTDHHQLELFPKRNFRCDCPTSAISHPCQLHKHREPENTTNQYGQNFRGVFCRCGRTYDAKTERETMIQCLACEDWFHESCCNLRERPPPRNLDEDTHENETTKATTDDDDAASDISTSSLPPPLVSGSDYDSLVCRDCVKSIPTLKRWAGTPGTIMVVRKTPQDPWIRLTDAPGSTESVDIENTTENSIVGTKRPRSSSVEAAPDSKRIRSDSTNDSSICLAPPINQLAQQILDSELDDAQSLGTGDLFLTENFRQRWCRCNSCLPSLQQHPFLLEEEETYEAPEDPDSALSLEELGMRALERIPRDRAIDGIRAFNQMRDDLVSYLRPFAQEGKVVTDQDVQSFFDMLREGAKKKSD